MTLELLQFTFLLALVVGGRLVETSAGPQEPASPSPAPAFENDDVVKMVRAGLGNSVVIAAIRAAPMIKFHLTTEDLLALKQEGVSDVVLEAMLAATQDVKNLPTQAAPPTVPVSASISAPEMRKLVKWNDIDQVEVAPNFRSGAYRSIVVDVLETQDTPLPPVDENIYAPATRVLAVATTHFVDGLRKGLNRRGAAVREDTVAGSRDEAGVLRIRGKLVSLNPGSFTKRWWGAGGATARIAGEGVDGATGQVLFRFTQERRTIYNRAFHNSYEDLLKKALREVGEDVAHILDAYR